MLNFVIISILSVCIGTLKAEATTIDKIKGLLSKQGKCEKICKETCTQSTLVEQKACWSRRDQCRSEKFASKIAACNENTTTANYRGNTQSLEVLEQIYQQVPKVRYYFDEKQAHNDQTKLKDLPQNERNELKKNLAKGIDIILQYCNKSISEMEKVRNPNLPPEEVKRTINQFKDMRTKIEQVKNIILDDNTYQKETYTYTTTDEITLEKISKTAPFTKRFLKANIMNICLLNLKNIANQGTGFKWKLESKNPPSLEECNKVCNSFKCLKDADIATYCKVHCKTCNNITPQQNTLKKNTESQSKYSEKAASITSEKSSDSQAIPPAAPPRPSRLPKASPPPLPPLPPAQG